MLLDYGLKLERTLKKNGIISHRESNDGATGNCTAILQGLRVAQAAVTERWP